jgi:DNA-directed RNA polymerase specialized sigma24 family protein
VCDGQKAVRELRARYRTRVSNYIRGKEKNLRIVKRAEVSTWEAVERSICASDFERNDFESWLLEKAEDMLMIEQAKEGHPEALTRLHSAYWNAITGYIVGHPGIENATGEDLAQEVWLRMQTSIGKYQACRGAFYTWVRRIADRVMLTYYSEKKWNVKGLLNDDEDNEDPLSVLDGLDTEIELRIDIRECYRIFLKAIFQKGGHPRRSIVYVFAKVLEYQPDKILNSLSNTTLRELAKRLEREYLEVSQLLSAQEVKGCFASLHRRVEQGVGNTTLMEYYGKDPRHNIDDWVHYVKKRVRLQLIKHGCSPKDLE